MDRRAAEISVSSRLDADPETAWSGVTTPEGINDEMRSWVFLLGIVPYDYDDLPLVALEPCNRFLEGSSMLITDRVRWVPRLGLPGRPLRPLIGSFFRHRQRRLRRRFGGRSC
jgi:hypothetical protein